VFRFKSPGFLGAHKVRGTGVPPVTQVYLFYVAKYEGAIAGEIVKC